MKILCCFKIVPDIEAISEDLWQNATNEILDTTYCKKIWNCFDESALEMILKLSDLSESFKVVSEINALTIGNSFNNSYLKTLYALGYTNAIRIDCPTNESYFKPKLIASIIGAYIRKIGHEDIIFMGSASADTSDKKVPFYLAEILNIPCISQVVDVEIIDEYSLKVTSSIDDVNYVYMVNKPCIIVIGNVPCTYLRVPTLKNKLKTKNKLIKEYQIKDVLNKDKDIYQDNFAFEQYQIIDKTRPVEIIKAESTAEKVNILIDKLKQWL